MILKLKLMVLCDFFNVSTKSSAQFVHSGVLKENKSCNNTKLRCVIMLLLMLAGNINANPGPSDMKCLPTPNDFLSRSGLGFLHINVQSLVPKMDMIRVWAHTTDADFMIFSETWLKKSVPDHIISVSGYNVFRADRQGKGGGIAI